MKNFSRVLLSIFIIMPFFAAMSCTDKPEPEKEKLALPEITVTDKTDTSFAIEWKAVENASTYRIDFMGDIGESQDTGIGFSSLESGATYEVRVQAVPEDLERYTESDWAAISVTLEDGTEPEPAPETDFSIDIAFDEPSMTLYCTVTPTDMNMYYYRETMTQAQIDQVGGGSVENAWQNAWDGYVAMYGNSVWDYYVSIGTDQWTASTTYLETEYVLVAGIDEDMNRITEVEYKTFETGNPPMSDNTFTIWTEDVTSSSAKVYVRPSNSDPFTLILVESEDIEGYTDDDLYNLIMSVYVDYIYDGNLFNQEMYMNYKEGTLYPNTEHTALVFGWNTVPNTEINKHTFRTLPPATSDDLTFEITAEVLGPYEIHGVFVPSEPDAQYFALAVADYQFEGYEDYPPQFIIDVCENSWVPITLGEYAEMFARTGTYDYVFNYFDDGIEPETSYIIWAVGFTAEGDGGTFGNWEIYDEILTTPADN